MSKKAPNKPIEKKPVFGDPEYGPEEDIYAKAKKVGDVDDDETESSKKDALPGDDLDIPGAELDDADEVIGEEDEENNYYSLGGDNHDDLEESKDE